MGKTLKKILCTLLVVVMCLTAAPLDGFVGIEWPKLPEINFGEIKLPEIDFGEWFSNEARAAETLTYGDFNYVINKDGTSTITGYTGIDSSVTIPSVIEGSTVTSIGQKSFSKNSVVQSIIMPESIRTIGDSAFSNCTSLKSITLHEGITSIANYAFYNCDSLTKVTIPTSLEKSGTSYYPIFANCDNLVEVEFAEGMKTIPADICKDISALQTASIPTTVTKIGGGAFSGCTSLKSITLHEGLVTIGESVFYNCDSLTKVTIPTSLEKSGTSYYPIFANCDNLVEVEFAEGMKTIPADICKDISALQTASIPTTVTKIGGGAFSGCTSLKSITLHEGLVTIGESVFYNCDSLTKVTIPTSLEKSGTSYYPIFANCDNLVEVEFAEGMKTIPADICKDISALQTASIPTTVTKIGGGAFSGCTSLKSITLHEGLVTIGESVFYNCDSLTKVTIPTSLEKSGTSYYPVFANCDNLIEVEFAEGTTKIVDNICKNMPALQVVTMPETITIIGDSAFRYCVKLENITIPYTIRNIDNYAFSNCENLVCITIYDGVERIGNYAFSECTNLTNVILPKSLKTIGSYAFENCNSLTKINIPKSLTECGEYGAFSYCSNLKEVEFEEGITKIVGNLFQYCTGLENVIIPETVTEIGFDAFFECVNLESIMMPDGLSVIGNQSFSNCDKLTELVWPKSLTTIDSYAFEYCDGLTKVKIPKSLVKCGEYGAFSYCSNLKEIQFEDGITKIIANLFQYCTGLESIAIPDTVTVIEYDAFYECVNLESVTMPKELISIGEETFNECTSLSEVVLPETVENIGALAFNGCNKLKNIKIPVSVNKVGKKAFYNCSALEWCFIENDFIIIGDSAFENCPKLYIACNEDSDTIMSVIDSELNYTFINSGIQDKSDRVLDRGKTYYRTTTSSTALSNAVTMIIDYKIKDCFENVVVNNISIKIPENVLVVESSVKFNGEYTTNYSVKKNVITVPINEKTGQIVFSLNMPEGCYPATYAKINYKVNGIAKSETVGIVNILHSSLTLNVPKESPESKITISGLVAPETNVDIYVNETLIKSITSSKTGVYYTEFEIPNAKFGRQYTITAKAMLKDGEKTVSGNIRLLENTPSLKEFLFYYEYAHTGKEKCIDLLSLNGKRPSTIIYIHSPMRFVVDIENPETIEQVYVTSTKNGDKKYIEAVYDEVTGKYIAEGYFEPTNVSYVPGTLNVEYTQKKKTAADMADEIIAELMSSGNSDKFPEELLSGEYKVIEDTKDRYEASIVLGNELSNLAGDEIRMIIETLSADFTGDLSGVMESYTDFYSYFVEDENGNPYYINLDYTDPETYAVIVNDISSNKVFNLILEFHDDPTVYSTIDDVISTVDNISFVSGFIVDQLGIQNDHEDLVAQIYANTKDPEELAWKLKKAEELEQNRQMYSTTMMLMKFAALAAIPVVGPEMAMATITFNLLLNAFDIMADFAWDLRKSKILYGSSGYNVNMLMDPSGFVYEATENNRLEGVTATIYYQDPETGKAIKWNAEDYDQVNPQITDDAGQYAWDVLEGMWQVKFEKDGYETTYSEWLPVPPPQLDVNIGMTTTKAPEVKDVVIVGNAATVEFTQYVDVSTVNTTNINIKAGSNTVNGTWSAVDAEEYVKDTSKLIARKFVFTANLEPEGNYSISIDKVINYAGIAMKSAYNKSEKPDVHEHSYTSTTVSATCTSNGKVIYTCGCNYSYIEVIPATGHSFTDGQSKCNNCDYNKAVSCGCNCHKGGISKIIFKIILIFQKILKKNKQCTCGVYHY